MKCFRCLQEVPDDAEVCPYCGQILKPILKIDAKNILDPESLREGDLVKDRFEIREKLGSGGIGTVFKVYDTKYDMISIVKMLNREFCEDQEIRNKFFEEHSKVLEVEHVSLVKYYELNEFKGVPYVVLQYIEGINLRRIINAKKNKKQFFSVNEIFPIFDGIAKALSEIHKFSYHGDLKPENVMVTSSGVEVTDYVISKVVPPQDFVSIQLGLGDVYYYLSPEYITDPEKITFKADIYALGVITYEMLTGIIPKAEPSPPSSINGDISEDIDKVILKALDKDPDNRFCCMEEFHLEFSKAAGKEGNIKELANAVKKKKAILFPKRKEAPLKKEEEEKKPTPLFEEEEAEEERMGEEKKEEAPLKKEFLFEKGVTEEKSSLAEEKVAAVKKKSPVLIIVILLIIIGGATGAYFVLGKSKSSAGVVAAAKKQKKVASTTPSVVKVIQKAAEKKINSAGTGKNVKIAVVAPKKEKELSSATLHKKGRRTRELAAVPEKKKSEKVKKFIKKKPEEAPPEKKKVAVVAPSHCPPDMVYIPPGSFIYGSPPSDPYRDSFLDKYFGKTYLKGFCIDKYEYPDKRDVVPKHGVSYDQAYTLCQAEGKRLCTEVEWEKACKGPLNLMFPYGNTFKKGVCDTKEGGFGRILPSGSLSGCRSSYGVHDMSGNALEWTSTSVTKRLFVTKGGSYKRTEGESRCSARRPKNYLSKESEIGFRCCKDAK